MNQNDPPADSKLPGHDECVPERVSRFLREELSERELGCFEEHLVTCENCRLQLEQSTAGQDFWNEARSSLNLELEFQADDSEVSQSESGDYISRMVLNTLAPSDDPHMLGRLGPYEVSGVIGQGGMGVVLKAYDGALSRFVALKVLRPYLAISGAARQRFFREAKAAATVSHDNVMPIHSVAEHNDLPYLVMPYVRGESLQQRISKSGPLSEVEVVRIGMQIAAGLAAAHAQGLVHRDIKPANIILEEGVDKLWITDFGLARLVDDASLTRTGVIAGTPEYMSPEQSRGESVDERSDLFSLGSVMYTMCTGHSPFRADSSYGVLRRITDDHPRPIRELNEQIPEWLDRLILGLLSKQPSERVAPAGEMAELLKQSLAHLQHPTAFELPGQFKALVPKPARARWKTFAWCAASLAVVVVSIVAAVKYSPTWSALSSNSTQTSDGSISPLNRTPAHETGQASAAQTIRFQEAPSSSEHLLPANTLAWVSIPDVKRFRKNFDSTQFGSLFKESSMQPFLERFNVEFDELMTEKHLPIGFDLFERPWATGEVCFAFADSLANKVHTDERILPIVLVDVSGFEQQAFDAVFEEFGKLEKARRDVQRHEGTSIVKTTFGPPADRKTVFNMVANGWLAIGEDVHMCLESLDRMKNGGANKSLAGNPAFQRAMARSKIDNVEPDVKWFAKPLGVVRLLNRFSRVDKNQNLDNWDRILQDQGFGVFSAIGGWIAFGSGDHELLHRCFVSKSHDGNVPIQEQLNRHKVLGLFDFANKDGVAIAPPRWVPTTAASCLVADWDKQKALTGIGLVYDAFLDEPGAFDRTLNDFRLDPDMRLDVKKLVSSLDRRTVLMTYLTEQIGAKSQQTVLGFKVKRDPGFVLESIRRAVGGVNIQILGYDAVESVIESELQYDDADHEFELPGNEVKREVENEKRFYVIANDYLIVSPDKVLIKQLLEKQKLGHLIEAEDYIQVHAALGKLTDAKRIGIRQFGRLDVQLEASYELFRRGEFQWPRWWTNQDDPNQPVAKRKQRFDGSALPKDYAKHVAPFLGLKGWVLENEDDGFLITGCVLKNGK